MHEPRVEQTLSQVLRKRVERWGDKPWIVAGDRILTYGEVDALSNRLANGLGAAGIGAGRTVLIMLPSTPDFVVVWCALAKLGAIEVPVNTHLKGAVLANIINGSCADTLLIDPQFHDRVEAVADDLTGLKRLILGPGAGDSGDPPPAIADRYETLRFGDLMTAESAAAPEGGPRHRDLMAVMYTSGTTGPSKGVMITHAHAYEYALSVVELLEMTEDDVYYAPLPLFHIAGQWAGVYACCIMGATIVLPESFSLGRFWDDVNRHRATCTFLLGAMANFLHGQPPREDDAGNSLERALIVPLLPEVEDFKQRFGCLVSTTWGSTEINVPTRSGFDLPDNRTCGRVAVDRYEVRIVDEDDNEVPPGVPGEAVVRAREPWILMAGYWNDPQATAWAWRNLWLHSGDMLMRDADGNLYFVDRTRDAIRRRGENISSMEVENEINAHEQVLESAVIPVASAHTEQEVMAVVVPKPGAALDPAALIRFLAPRMAYFMVPRYVDIVAELPKTQTGKIQKFELRARGMTDTTWDREAAGIKLEK
jgi:crotonobetaine/carnitine-CoA ligase